MPTPRQLVVSRWFAGVVLMLLPALYVAAFGPACWVSSHSGSGVRVVEFVFQPLLRLSIEGPEEIKEYVYGYARLGAKEGWYVRGGCFTNDCYWSGH